MNKSLVAVGVIVALGVVWTGGAWYTGKKIETHLEDMVAQANAQLKLTAPESDLEVSYQNYHRGVFSSQLQLLVKPIAGKENPWIKSGQSVIFNESVDHGPFPLAQLKKLNLIPSMASIQTTLVNNEVSKPLFDMAKGETPFEINSRIGYSGDSSSDISLKPLNFEQEDWAILERSFHNDTLQYWIKDSLIYNMDTLLFTAEYLRTDTLRQLSLYNDTLKFIMKKVKAPKKKEKKKDKDNDSIEVPEIQFMQMNAKISSSLDVYKPLRFSFAEPLQTYDAGKIHLEQKRDTLWIPVADSLYTFLQDSIAIRDYTLTYKWTPGESYRIVMDSTAFTNIYGLFTNTYKQEFKVKALEDYANLYLSISGVSDSAFVEILDSGDKPVRTAPVINGGAEFMYMNPGTYYARLFIDRNGNGKYDTGNYSEKRQPEEVSYYPQELELKANWDIEQDWDIYATPVDKQKPDKIKKNKPKEKKRNY